MKYDQQILQILSKVGRRGISVRMLSKHIYNMNCTLFSSPDPKEVHRSVQQFLILKSKLKSPLIESTGKWGCYRLNNRGRAYMSRQMLEFSDDVPLTEDRESDKNQQDLSLSLFSHSDFTDDADFPKECADGINS